MDQIFFHFYKLWSILFFQLVCQLIKLNLKKKMLKITNNRQNKHNKANTGSYDKILNHTSCK